MLKIDFHVHSNLSLDGRSTLRQLALAAKKRGLNAIVICDHNLYALQNMQQIEDVYLIPGIEISSHEGHILALFCKSNLDLDALCQGGLPRAATVIAAIHSHDGLAVAAHPFAKAPNDLLLNNVDIIETINARATFKNKEANRQATAYALSNKLPQLAGSDAHSAAEIGNAYTQIDIELNPNHAAADMLAQIRAALLAGHSRPILSKTTKHYLKGLSQFRMAWRRKRLKSIIKALVYLIYSILLDIIKR